MSAENEILKRHPNLYCKGQRAHSDKFREGYDRTFGRLPWYKRRDLKEQVRAKLGAELADRPDEACKGCLEICKGRDGGCGEEAV